MSPNPEMWDELSGRVAAVQADDAVNPVEARQQRVIAAARGFVEDQHSLHPLNPEWDQAFLDLLSDGRIAELDRLSNADLSRLAGRSTHEVKAWVAAFAALSAFGPYRAGARYYRPIPEWIAGFGALGARPLGQPDA